MEKLTIGILTALLGYLAIESTAAAPVSCEVIANRLGQSLWEQERINHQIKVHRERAAQLQSELEVIHMKRRQGNCVGDRNIDRNDINYCIELNQGSAEIRRSIEHGKAEIQRLLHLTAPINSAVYWNQRQMKSHCAGQSPTPVGVKCDPWTSFTRSPNQAIAGNNIATLPQVSILTCQKACMDQEGCKSFDYGPKSGTCYLSVKNSQNIGEPGVYFVGRPLGKPDWPFDYYERTCF